jgi:hypothetical protein
MIRHQNATVLASAFMRGIPPLRVPNFRKRPKCVKFLGYYFCLHGQYMPKNSKLCTEC